MISMPQSTIDDEWIEDILFQSLHGTFHFRSRYSYHNVTQSRTTDDKEGDATVQPKETTGPTRHTRSKTSRKPDKHIQCRHPFACLVRLSVYLSVLLIVM